MERKEGMAKKKLLYTSSVRLRRHNAIWSFLDWHISRRPKKLFFIRSQNLQSSEMEEYKTEDMIIKVT